MLTRKKLANEDGPGSVFKIKNLPSVLRMANSLANQLAYSAPSLTTESLVRAASRKAGLVARLPRHIEVALEVLCRSLRDDVPQLHWFGKMNQYNLIVTGLAEFMLVDEIFRNRPELNDVPLNNPVIITGLPRSGTTFLHRLLSCLEAAESIPLYRHIFPTPRRLPTRLIESTILFEPWRWASNVYDINAIHFVRPGLPDECNFGMRLTMCSPIYWSIAPTYNYLEWLMEQDMRETYQFYRKVLILHQMNAPDKRLTLKCPHHLSALPALNDALPEAHIIQTHRDPVETTPSECSLILALQAISVSELDWKKTVACNYNKVRTAAERCIDFSNSPAGKYVLHVDYRRLIQDPVELAAEVHRDLKLPWNENHSARVTQFCSANRQHKHGTHRYSLAQFGLSPEKIDSDFKAYREQFLFAS